MHSLFATAVAAVDIGRADVIATRFKIHTEQKGIKTIQLIWSAKHIHINARLFGICCYFFSAAFVPLPIQLVRVICLLPSTCVSAHNICECTKFQPGKNSCVSCFCSAILFGYCVSSYPWMSVCVCTLLLHRYYLPLSIELLFALVDRNKFRLVLLLTCCSLFMHFIFT